ncbi:isoflavone reductase [Pyricularia oryzae 70-15]|uniref:Isoflavone reductase n=3 Tax=Pyricularia oryzae TaxID=318829 RepID=G4N2I7_PYRO7|nr:isoflavone reductase [Pyricularia oryzae 70-15]EHA51696.1 isoflavone reductase [Pyricularia oryzae 70-15]ELQ37962.1 isoflavone reductase family protein [Pyricularia oryzae Y34]KAI7908890.1 isoflavone reductase [Pyricularia oryzae]KAI7909311.1 isoflavone reductase [Pyricularia oryzae]
MAFSTKLRVVVAGASGETGQSIVRGLLAESSKFDVIALARPESADNPAHQELARAGATVETADFLDVQALAERLAGADVVISCILPIKRAQSEALIDAAHRARVDRFVPSFFAMVMPPRGVMAVRELREELLDRCKLVYLPYTVIDVGQWYQIGLPPPWAPPMPQTEAFVGDGETPSAMIDKDDVGRYVARIITDPRTLNRSVFAYGEVTSQKTILAELKAATGREVPWHSISVAGLEARLAELRSSLSADPTSPKTTLDLAMTQYLYSRMVRGDNAPDRAQYLGYLDAKALYPDFEFKSLRHYIKEVVAGDRDHRVYVGREITSGETKKY